MKWKKIGKNLELSTWGAEVPKLKALKSWNSIKNIFHIQAPILTWLFPLGHFDPQLQPWKRIWRTWQVTWFQSWLSSNFVFFFLFSNFTENNLSKEAHNIESADDQQTERPTQRPTICMFPERNFFYARIYSFEYTMPICLPNDIMGPQGLTQMRLPWNITETTFRPYSKFD